MGCNQERRVFETLVRIQRETPVPFDCSRGPSIDLLCGGFDRTYDPDGYDQCLFGREGNRATDRFRPVQVTEPSDSFSGDGSETKRAEQ